MSRQRHYVNPKDPGEPCFVTTTVLDFVHAFHRPEARDCMTLHLARECRLERAALYGYVVMPHHIHMIVRPRPNQTISRFMAKFKPNTRAQSRISCPTTCCVSSTSNAGSTAICFGRDRFEVSYRERRHVQPKAAYIHVNPVEAGTWT